MTSESCAPLVSAPDSQRMMSYGNPAFPDILGFDDTLLNGEVQLQNVRSAITRLITQLTMYLSRICPESFP